LWPIFWKSERGFGGSAGVCDVEISMAGYTLV
jgi:hypothetical protein